MHSPEKSLPEGLLNKPVTAMEKLLSQTNNLTVLDEDGWEINEDGGAEVGKLCAIGRLCSNRTMNRSLIKTILGRVWGLPEKVWGVEIKHTSMNAIFLVFSFKSSQDLNRILIKNPWFLNNGTLILERMKEIPSNWESCLSRIQLSGRILSLPPKLITQKNLERLAGMAGEIIEVQKADVAKISSKGFFTFKVWCDLSKPICPGFLFPYEGRKLWLPFRYDRLPYMCFNCGCIGHEMKVCLDPTRRVVEDSNNIKQGFGTWLKVDGKKDITYIFGKGTMGSGSNLNSGIPQCIDNRNPIPTNLRKESEQGKLKNSALLTPPAIAVAQYTHESGIADMEVIVEKGSSSIDKFVGKRTGLINEVSQTPEEKNLINHKRNGDWREELMGNSSSILATPNSLDPQLSTTIQKASSIETVQLFEVPVTYESNINKSGLSEGKTKRRKITPKRLKNGVQEALGFTMSKRGRITKSVKRLSKRCGVIPFQPTLYQISNFSYKAVGRSFMGGIEGKNKTSTRETLIIDEGEWKTEEIASWFHKEDIPWVLGITPSKERNDTIGWSLTTNGLYTVASGYKLRFRDPNIAECSDNSANRAWWKVVWGSRLTPKMKIFIWRVFHNWLQVKTELIKRGMSMNITCNRCKSHVEDVCHALWNCPKLHNVWKHFGFIHLFPSSLRHAPDFLMVMKGKLSKEEFIFFIGITWLIWFRRNKCIFQNKDIEDSIWIPWAMEMLELHLASAQKDSISKLSKDKVRWSPHPLGSFIINTDASLIDGQPGCGLGVIILDHLGALVAAATEFIPGCLSVPLAETLAIRLALKLAATKSLQNFYIASDSQSVITALKGHTRINTDWGILLEDCILASKSFYNLSFIFTPRKCNTVAHCLANWSRLFHVSDVWTSYILDCAAASLKAYLPLGASV
ncbi:hypothetical protein G4B88_000747 [Cannabis sativa]|uniref:CCHC-type domain-containing protein n=1 Tax=Cannabis sativa TaxID=3483 RepID=A0A7J6I3T3_CANSA|nr:hypothetical protein G4B88_000747 [Cannabis sativa]